MTAALDHGDDTALHTARKAAKRLRYATEVTGSRPKGLKQLQKALGHHQDAVVARPVLRELGASAENGFSFGVLLGAGRRARRRDRGRPARTVARARKPGVTCHDRRVDIPATRSPTCAASRSSWSARTSRPTGCARSAARSSPSPAATPTRSPGSRRRVT